MYSNPCQKSNKQAPGLRLLPNENFSLSLEKRLLDREKKLKKEKEKKNKESQIDFD